MALALGTMAVEGVVSAVKLLLPRVFPDPEARAKAEQELLHLTQTGELKELEVRMSAIIMEAQSQDPWTSRARPSFLYVMYAMILAAIPMGVLFAFAPDVAAKVSGGVGLWLDAIPAELWALFGAGYLGYSWARSADKRTILRAGTGPAAMFERLTKQ